MPANNIYSLENTHKKFSCKLFYTSIKDREEDMEQEEDILQQQEQENSRLEEVRRDVGLASELAQVVE